MYLSLLALVSSADVYPSPEVARMRYLMQNAYSSTNEDLPLCVALYRRNAESNDVCTWPGVECNDSTVRRIQLFRDSQIRVSIEWLPPTVKHLHLNRMQVVEDWNTASLPRDLISLLVEDCFVESVHGTGPNKPIRALVNLRKLPARLEEFLLIHVLLDGSSVLDLSALPPSMYLLSILFSGQGRVVTAFIDFDNLPPNLRCACVATWKGPNVRVKRLGTAPADGRVATRKDFALGLLSSSKYRSKV